MDRAYELELLPSVSTGRKLATDMRNIASVADDPVCFYDERMDIIVEREVSAKPMRRTPVRYVNFDTFDDPETTASEAKQAFCDLALLLFSAITAIVAIILLV